MEDLIQLLQVVAWPLVVLIVAIIVIFAFRKEIRKLFSKDKVTFSSKYFSASFKNADKGSKKKKQETKKQLAKKPESAYTDKDWFDAAFIAHGDKRYKDAFDYLEQALRLTTTKEQVANILYNQGVVLGKLDRPEDAIAVYEKVAERYSQDTESDIRAIVAMSLVNKGVVLRESGRPEDATAVYDEVNRRYGQDTEPGIREQVARSLVNKATVLEKSNHDKEAIKLLHQAEAIVTELGVQQAVKEIKDQLQVLEKKKNQ